MTKVFSLGEFAAHLATVQADIRAAEEAAVRASLQDRVAHGEGHDRARAAHVAGAEAGDDRAKGAWQHASCLSPASSGRQSRVSAPHREGGDVVGYVGSNNEKAVIHVAWNVEDSGAAVPRPTAAAGERARDP